MALAVWLLVLATVVKAEAAPHYQHLYLGYVSPYNFVRGYDNYAPGYPAYHGYRYRRSSMDHHPMSYDYQHDPMAYSHSYGYNPMFYPYKMFSFPYMKLPAMPGFPSMHFPSMPRYHYPSSYNSFRHPFMHSDNFYNNNAYNSYQPHPAPAPAPAHASQHPFGEHFMKMMGFHGGNHGGSYHANHDDHNAHTNHGKGNNYEMSYSKSYSMNMDYTNGKGHMVTKDSSYMNDNGKVYKHDNPAQHYTANADGKFVLDKHYNSQQH